MTMVLVDSSAWIEGLRRRGNLEVKLALEALLDAYAIILCSPVRLEVLGGARTSDRNRLSYYFSIIPYRACEADDWERAVALAWQLRDQGITVPWMDVLIAAIALHDGTRVYAVDEHFMAISKVTGLPLYEPGYGGAFKPA